MTSAPDRVEQHGQGRILWITGLAGAGKTTLARALVEVLHRRGTSPLLLDGDELRHALDDEAALDRHDLESRRRRAWRIARLARFAATQHVPVVVATISLFHDVQAWNRSAPVLYAEVVLDAPLALLRTRNPLYAGGVSGASGANGANGASGASRSSAPANVVGVDLPAEMPLHPELTLSQGFETCELPDHLSKALALWDAMRCTDPQASSSRLSR